MGLRATLWISGNGDWLFYILIGGFTSQKADLGIMNAPFSFLASPRRQRWMQVAIVLALGLTIFFGVTGGPLQTAVAPAGILSYEFAGTVAQAQAMSESWGEDGRLLAAFGLGLDFLYPLLYAAAISLACLWAAERLGGQSVAAKWGIWLAWGVWLAALLDYIENVALLLLLLGNTAVFLPPLAFICAAIKFALILAGIFYTVGVWLLGRRAG